MSIERKLNQSQWGVMRTEKARYNIQYTNTLSFDLNLDGTYYGIAGSATGSAGRFHLLGMTNKDGETPSGLDGKSIIGLFQEDRNTDKLVFRSWYVIEQSLNAGKALFSGSTDLLKDQPAFSVTRTNNGATFLYVSKDGNAFFKINIAISATGTITDSVAKRVNTAASYRTWDQILSDATGGTLTAVTNVIAPLRTANNNGYATVGTPNRVFIYADANPLFGLVSYNWELDTTNVITADLEAWWNAKLPSDAFDAGTFSIIQSLNHPNAGLLAIVQKDRQVDGETRRYWVDFAQGSVVDTSGGTSDDGFVLDAMTASIANVFCYYAYDNDKHDNTGGKLVYAYYKGVQDKASGFVLRLWNYDLDGRELYAEAGGDSSIFMWSGTTSGKEFTAEDIAWIRRDNNSFRLEREDVGNVLSDALSNEAYYLTGTKSAGKNIFVGYERYAYSGVVAGSLFF